MLELMRVRDSDVGLNTENDGDDEEPSSSNSSGYGFGSVLAALLDPILEAIEASAQVGTN
jgi:hypothetical protein